MKKEISRGSLPHSGYRLASFKKYLCISFWELDRGGMEEDTTLQHDLDAVERTDWVEKGHNVAWRSRKDEVCMCKSSERKKKKDWQNSKLDTRKVVARALPQPLWQVPHWSHDVEQCSCAENKMLFGTHNNKWCNLISKSRQERLISAYSKNVNLPVLGQGNLPSNRSQLLSSEEKRRKRRKDIWNQQLCGLYPRAADSETPLARWHRAARLHKTSYTIFPFFVLKLPVISPPFSRLDFLTHDICVPDVMWKAE